MKDTRPAPSRGRAGVAYLLTMLYLMLFSVLAVGFAAASAVAVKLAEADRCSADAQSAAESGLELVRYQLGQIAIPPDVSDADLLTTISKSLERQLDASGHHVSVTDGVIELPAANDLMILDPALGTAFHGQFTIQHASVVVKIVGHGRGDLVSRAVQLEFQLEPHKPTATDAIHLTPIADTYREVSP